MVSVRLALFLAFFPVAASSSSSSSDHDGECFLQCLRDKIPSDLVYTRGSSNFTHQLLSSIHDPPKFFTTNATARPLCVVTPTRASHVQAAVLCGRANGVRLRVRSGGHDYEGLSYRSVRPEVFAVLDLAGLRAVDHDGRFQPATAWVGSGATIGELYYAIAKNDSRVAFPAGVCPTVGVGGHFSGGGIGMMMRKHGLAIDNVIDAKLVDAEGALVDRAAMGEDLFWAIRGGGGGGQSFGVVLAWKVRLAQVPSTVTVVNIVKTLDQGGMDILTRWQHVGPSSLPDDLTIRVIVQAMAAQYQPATLYFHFQALYLGSCNSLVPTMSNLFPELDTTSADCQEMTWLQSVAFINFGNRDTPVEALLRRPNTTTTPSTTAATTTTFTKKKSDYVRRAISKGTWENIFSTWFATSDGAGAGLTVILEPHGGFMGSIPATATPYPHRRGVLYNIQYIVTWQGNGDGTVTTPAWIGSFYGFMGRYVSRKPREAYVNYRDLDIGQNVVVEDVSTFDGGKVWAERYYMSNYRRLAAVKAAVDPTDYFRNEQSIPPLLRRPRS